MYSIINGYKNHNEMYYSNIRNIQFSKQSDLMHIGNKKAITTYSDSNNKFIDTAFKQNNGVIIYQTLYDKNKALRIYNDYAEYKYTFHNDEKLVSELQKRQANVKLTDFPTGIASIDGYTIGQEIPYYENYQTLLEAILTNNIKNPILIYSKILNVFKELQNNGITYTDIHTQNIMINTINTIIKIIDFEPFDVFFDKDLKTSSYSQMIKSLKSVIININRLYNIEFDKIFSKAENLVQIEEVIHEKQYSLLKK